jgi:hypothetical protein
MRFNGKRLTSSLLFRCLGFTFLKIFFRFFARIFFYPLKVEVYCVVILLYIRRQFITSDVNIRSFLTLA